MIALLAQCRFAAIVFLCSLISPTIHAAEYKGVGALFEKLNTNKPQPRATAADSAKAVRDKIQDYKKDEPSLPPDDAARRWLALCEQLRAAGGLHLGTSGEKRVMSREILAVIPPPTAWESLRKQIAGKNQPKAFDASLKLLGDLLGNDEPGQWRDVQQLKTALGSIDRRGGSLVSITNALTDQSADPAKIVEGTEERITAIEAGRGGGEVKLPDLVTLAGKEKAETLIKRVLLHPDFYRLEILGTETEQLAREVAIANIEKIRRPPWELVKTLNSIELYEALNKKFPPDESERDSYSRREAALYYLLGLVVAQRLDDATRVAIELNAAAQTRDDSLYLPYEPLDALDRAGHTEAVCEFLSRLLEKHPEIPFWNNYVAIAARIEKSDEALNLVRKSVAASGNLTTRTKSSLEVHLATALLAADHVDEGVAALQRAISGTAKDIDHSPPRVSPTPANPWQSQRNPAEALITELADRGLMLAKVGDVLGRKEWLNEGSDVAFKAASKLCHPDFDSGYQRQYSIARVADFLFRTGRGPDAEALLQNNVVAAIRASAASRHPMPSDTRNAALQLVWLYSAAGRADDVLALLDQSENWGAIDLAEIVAETPSSAGGHSVSPPLGYMIAQALASKGRLADARKVLDATMDKNNSLDREYELLLKIGGKDILPRLDLLFQRDQFEERPLIWKAHLLRLAQRLDEAEKAARAAIAIDPSDGEQGPGDRMRVYAVLADILQDKGDTKQANSMREAVKAIRISEDADRYYDAGLLSRGTSMYQDALNHFADAYCVQSRLALRLSELGRNDEAEEHYRRAYELMPESFGRMESHCFGCEGAFSGRRAQTTAEKVFTRLAAASPNKPQIYYLFGYLREQQQRFSEALELYRKAVSLDRDYLNAWKHINELGQRVAVPIADRDAAALNLLRLDPQSKHEEPRMEKVRDLRGLWDTVAAATKLVPPTVTNLYPLPLSRAAMEEAKKRETSKMGSIDSREILYSYGRGRSKRGPVNPGEAIANQQAVAAVGDLLDAAALLPQ